MTSKQKRAELIAQIAGSIAVGMFTLDQYTKVKVIVDKAEAIVDEVEERLGEPIYGWAPGDTDTPPDVPDYYDHLLRDPDPSDPNDDLPFGP